MIPSVEIWRDGQIETVDALDFRERARNGEIAGGALVRFQGTPSFTEPGELLPLIEEMRGQPEPPPEPETPAQRSLLIECPACQRTVSVEAKACPSCGHPVRGPAQGTSTSNVVAAIASFFIPGLGQLSQGRFLAGLCLFFVTLLAWFVLLGWVIHLVAAFEAATWRGVRPA